MSIIDFTDKKDDVLGAKKGDEIFDLIADERMLRALFESNIFKLRKIQKEAIQKGLFFRKSFLACAPSGSGKTLIGELCAINNVFQKFGKSIYLVPFKALASEKYFHFKKSYGKYGVRVALSIGDYDVEDSKLEKADLIVTTYEKMDSILRNFYDKEWIFDISTIIVDEIHVIGDSSRGPRLESLIVRLNEFLHNPQIIGLSATINNPDFFNRWLISLKNDSVLIKSDDRPVPLHYQIKVSRNKSSAIKKITKIIIANKGQLLIFVNTRKGTQKLAQELKNLIEKELDESNLKYLKRTEKNLGKIKGVNRELKSIIRHGVAFHHAGLLPRERKTVEDLFRRKKIKIVCCTTTLSAGINMPVRTVILKDFKKYVTSGQNIKNFTGFHQNGDGFSYFKPFSSNEVFQILGRAGRPGLDSVGYGIILVNNIEERAWVEENYFKNIGIEESLIPKYNDLESGLNKINVLKEQVLLRVYEEKRITFDQLISFFKKTFFWFSIKEKTLQQEIPIDQLLMINEITPTNILKLHSNSKKVEELKLKNIEVKISKITKSTISGFVKTDFGFYTCQFDIEQGILCSCGFKNGISDNFSDQAFSFEFCDHVTKFLLYIIKVPDKNFQKYANDIIPKAAKNQYILNYLFEKGLIIKNADNTIKCSQFGKLIVRLYLYPVSGVLIRNKLENEEINSARDLISNAYDVLKAENRVRDFRMLEPLLEWVDEEPVDQILERYKIMGGDLYATRDNLERIITFIGIIASHLSSSGTELQDKLAKVAEMSETLKIRLHYGIREELFDLVLRLNNVARARARILYKAGYHTATQVMKEKAYILNKKTRLGINLCKKIVEGAINKKKQKEI